VAVGAARQPFLRRGHRTTTEQARLPRPRAHRLAVGCRHRRRRLQRRADCPLAIAAGDDMVLFNATNPTATANAVIASISAAVARGKLPRSRLDKAAVHVLTAKGISLCPGMRLY
jgi:hypothetical protein